MAPIRRYLRITPYSVLEVRIHLDTPSLLSWLLNPRLNILNNVIESVRPLVLPKLREEVLRSKIKGKGKGRKKGVRDVVTEEDFEVSVFLTETSTRHAILKRIKTFREPAGKRRAVGIDALTGNTAENAMDVDAAPGIPREEEDDMAGLTLDSIPTASAPAEEEPTHEEMGGGDDDDLVETQDPNGSTSSPRRSTRARSKRPRASPDADDNGEDSLFVSQSPPSSPGFATQPPSKSKPTTDNEELEPSDDKKKMAMKTTYDGYAIYGRVLCLIVKRRDQPSKNISGGQANMESWIASTQAPPEEES